MREMHWTWAEYEATPEYVRMFVTELSDLAQSIRAAKIGSDG